MISYFLDLLYLLMLICSCPIWIYRMLRHGRYRSGIGEMFGGCPIRYGLQPIIWVYGVSVGEIKAASRLVQQLHSQLPDYRVVISAWTDTGMAEANKLYGQDHTVFRRPLDFSFAVRRALKRMRPDMVILMEGDVWPNFLAACNRRQIPVFIVNGRMSPKGFAGYKKLGGLASRLLFNRVTAIGVQEEVYAYRLKQLGVEAGRIHVTGMVKFETACVAEFVEGQAALALEMGITSVDKLIVAGGTGPGEEQQLLQIFAQLKSRHPAAKLAIVPRLPQRFEEVAQIIQSAGFKCIRRSATSGGVKPAGPADAVLLGDTMGELRKFYGLAAAVFVGRSLVPMGGSDMIESAALGKATAFGPHTFNFPQADALADHGCRRVADSNELLRQLDEWLSKPAKAAADGKAAQDYVVSQQGATRRNVEMICQAIGRVPAVSPGGIATDKIGQSV